jgi:23S rRNA pseudouridine2605 synthase
MTEDTTIPEITNPETITPETTAPIIKNKKPSKKKNSSLEGIRIAKYIAHSGYCSRREAEKLIAEGRVKVNGVTIDTPATIITDHSVKINNKLINNNKEVELWLFHKPKETITTHKDPQGRTTVFEILPKNNSRLISIGRLDFNTEGLLLLTNNGDLARYLELPKTGWVRKYRARVFGKLNHERLEKLTNGITIDGVRYRGIKVKIEIEKESNSWLEISIEEGKNREIRKVMEHLGLQVNRLIRIGFGPFNLERLGVGELAKVNKSVLKNVIDEEILNKII